MFIVLVAGAMAYSVYDAYSITSTFNIQIELEPATVYAMNHMQNNESIMVLAPFNFFSQDMIKFYLAKNGNNQIQTYQYPLLPIDTYTPTFNITELISECKQYNVKYLFTYEQGGTVPYYNTTLNLSKSTSNSMLQATLAKYQMKPHSAQTPEESSSLPSQVRNSFSFERR